MTLSEKAREIADRPAFPAGRDPLMQSDESGRITVVSGMTYHQWLVGQALAGSSMAPHVSAADWAIARADAVCEALAEREP